VDDSDLINNLITTEIKMAQFNITATSASKERTVTNADTNTRKKDYANPVECVDQAAADVRATKYARDLNADEFDQAKDWVGTATAI
jgi:hypothetical protein